MYVLMDCGLQMCR